MQPGQGKGSSEWMRNYWRPMMAVLYLVVCVFDFVLFPIFWSIIQVSYGGVVTLQWEPLTLKGGGLFHVAMGSVLGVAAWTRGKEKLKSIKDKMKEESI